MENNKFRTIFVTGGAGYIGSNCIVELLEAGYQVITCDNFSNSVSAEDGDGKRLPPSLERGQELTGKNITFYECDLVDYERLENIFSQHKFDCVIHFAATKSVGESMHNPFIYYKNNLIGTINLLEVMQKYECFNLVFSSSSTVYGKAERYPITEDHPIGKVASVYGRTKYITETMLMDLSSSDDRWKICSLRYFNPIGAHPSGRIGEDNTKPVTNLMPFLAQVAIGDKPSLSIFGKDYDTPDGTCIRDYIHVMDLVAGHLAALAKIEKDKIAYRAYNLGRGKGLSVLELVKLFEQTTGMTIPIVWTGRRAGDVDKVICDAQLAYRELGWKAKYDADRMCEDFWRWKKMNPHGYRSKSEE